MKLPYASLAQIEVGGVDPVVTISIECRSADEAASLRASLQQEVSGVTGGLTFQLRKPIPRSVDELLVARSRRRP